MMKKPNNILIVEEVITEAAHIDRLDIMSRSRQKQVTDARAAIWWVARDTFGYAYSYLGRMYNRDHTTVIHGVNKIRKSEEAKSKIIKLLKKKAPETLSGKMMSPKEPVDIENWDI